MTATPPIPWPRPRPLARPQRSARWAWAVIIAATLNLAIVVALAHLSQVHGVPPAPPLVTRSMTVRPPPPPPPPPRPVVAATPVAARMPSLDLPPVALTPTATPLPLTPPALPGQALPLPDLALDLALVAPAETLVAPAVPVIADPDTPATLAGAFDLERHYPRSARLRGITGTTVLELTIDAEGRVRAAEVLRSTPPGVFEDAARRLALGLTFRPATTGGQPTASRQRTSIAWTLK